MRSGYYWFLSLFQGVFAFFYRNRLKVLAYHKVPDATKFENQISYLKSRYNIISINDVFDLLLEKKPLPNHSLLITFDDGDVSVLENGFPILNKFNLPSCLFVITQLINTNEEVWIKRVEFQEISKGRTYGEARKKVNYFKNLDNSLREEEMKNYNNFETRQLTSKELLVLHQSGMFIGNHTHTHPMLDKCSPKEINREFNESQIVFKELELPGYDIFAYPNGNTSKRIEMQLRNLGMKLIFLFDHKVNKLQLDPFNISRIRVDSDTEMNEFKAKVSGLHPFILNLKST